MKTKYLSKKRDPVYPIITERKSFRSTYNSSVIYLAVLATVIFYFENTLLAWGVYSFLVINLVLGIAIDPQRNSVKFSEMPIQLVAYFHLLVNYLYDYLLIFLLTFLVYWLIRPLWLEISIWGGYSVIALYAFFIVSRTFIFVRYWYQVSYKWDKDDVEPPLRVNVYNFSTQEKAKQHLLWSYFIGNSNIFAKCAIQTVAILTFEMIIAATGISLSSVFPVVAQDYMILVNIIGIILGLYCLRVYFPFGYHAFYKIHRTLHESRVLYSFLHKVHHKSIVTTPLSEGTISPLEFHLSVFILPFYVLLPDWIWCAYQMYLARTDWKTHTTVKSGKEMEGNLLHTNHHLRPKKNYGLFPDSDAFFGTLIGMSWTWELNKLEEQYQRYYPISYYKDHYKIAE